jgi:hypothetical protein
VTANEQPVNPVNGGSRPVPDPTELTDRAIARLREEIRLYIDGQLETRDERLRGIDEATRLRLTQVTAVHDGVGSDIATAVAALEKLMNEKFDSNERLRVEQKKDTKDAVDAALNAAKEAVKEQTAASEKAINKSEQATGAEIGSLRRELGDLKDREVDDVRTLRGEITTVAGVASGSVAQRAGAKEDRTGLYGALAALGGVIFLVIAIVGFVVATASRVAT